jgi:tetratricopeptide (TPR) repeat protein
VWAVYANSLDNPFHFDDWHVVAQNADVHDPRNIPRFFTDASVFSMLETNRDYRPLFLTSMSLCWWLGRGSTLPFHLASVALHTLSVLLAYGVMRRLLVEHGAPCGITTAREHEWTAFWGAALFALHPLATEPVNYISSQSELWVAALGLLSFGLFLAPGVPCRIGSVAAYFAALLAKPNAVVWFLVLLLWQLLLARRRRWIALWPYAAATLAYLVLRKLVIPEATVSALEPAREWYLTQTRALVFHYLKLALLPADQSIDHDYALSASLGDLELIAAVSLLALAGLGLFLLRRMRLVVFWAAWFPACMVVTSYLVVLQQVVTEHRVYLSLVGFCALLAMGLAGMRRLLPGQEVVVTAAASLLLLSYGFATWQRNRVWSSTLALWQEAAALGDGWRAHMNYGIALADSGRMDEALLELRRAVALGDRPFAHINLGSIYIRAGQVEQGLVHLRAAVAMMPAWPDPHFHLAYGLMRAGQDAEAERELLRALELRPNYIKALQYLAELQRKQGRIEEALATERRLLDADPSRRREQPP